MGFFKVKKLLNYFMLFVLNFRHFDTNLQGQNREKFVQIK